MHGKHSSNHNAYQPNQVYFKMEKPCDCAKCKSLPTANERWGYDETLVPATLCLCCHEPIGAESYLEVTGLARFGQMNFIHTRCNNNLNGNRTSQPR